MVAGDDEPRRLQPQAVEKYVSRLELAVPGPLAQIPGDNQGRWPEARKKFFQRFYLLEIGVAAEVDVGEMNDSDGAGHQKTRIR